MSKNKRRARLGAMSRKPPLDSASSVTGTMVQQAMALHLNGQLEQAEALYHQVLDRQEDNFDATHLLGVVAMQTGRWAQAVELLSRATQLNSNHPQALANFGSALLYTNRPDEALRQYDRALQLDPRFAGALNNHGNALQMLGRHEEAAESFRRLLELAPQFDFALGNGFQSRRHCCDWQDFSLQVAHVLEALSAGRRVDRPFSFLSVSGSAAHQLECARSYAIYMCPSAHPALWTGERYTHERIRVAYISADFRAHVVSNLMVAIYERHDREQFHTIGVSLKADEGADVVIRARNSLTQFVDASRLSDDEAAQLIRELEVDIAVDLTGYTQGCRPGIFARRPAPVQINFLGFPATLGVPYIDYIIADEFAIPASSESAYAERVVRMPDSFQPNDERRSQLAQVPTPLRSEVGLPSSGIVFCTFNNTYKLNPAFFDIWARIMREVPDSVLWLIGDTSTIRRHLCAEAAARGVEPARLVFAARVPYPEHLARLRLADLFLDSLPFNAGATASDALWSGVPVLTCVGEALASRMAGSLLRAIGLPELITFDAGEYERRAIELANDRDQLAEIKNRLAANRATHPLFNTERYCRHLEAAYRHMCSRVQSGEPPASFTVPTDGR